MSDNGGAMKYDVEIRLRKSGVQGDIAQDKMRDETGEDNEEERQMTKTNVERKPIPDSEQERTNMAIQRKNKAKPTPLIVAENDADWRVAA